MRKFTIDNEKISNIKVYGIKNITDQTRHFNFLNTSFSLAPRQKRIFRLNKSYVNTVTNMCRGNYLLKEIETIRTIKVTNVSKIKLSALLEDGRPVILNNNDSIEIAGVRLLEFYREQGLTVETLEIDGKLVDVPKEADVKEIANINKEEITEEKEDKEKKKDKKKKK